MNESKTMLASARWSVASEPSLMKMIVSNDRNACETMVVAYKHALSGMARNIYNRNNIKTTPRNSAFMVKNHGFVIPVSPKSLKLNPTVSTAS